MTRHYGSTVAVSNLELTLRKGEVLGLLGPNGAGKSTTMKMLTGNLAPSAGEVRINGISLREQPKLAKRQLGYLPEQPPLYPELTVNEYLRFCASLHGMARKERDAAVTAVKRECGLTDVGTRLIANLSKGYQQRVGIAQAIIHRPSVVILDEPTVGLDPIQIREIRKLIADLGRHHSVILSSHILPEIQTVCSRVMIIAAGQVVYNDSLQATKDEQFSAVVAAFRNPPPASELLGIDGVSNVAILADGRFRLELRDHADPREALAGAAASQGWGLFELAAQTRSLEEIFVALTSGEDLQEAA